MLQGVVLRRETQPYDSPQIQLQEQPKGCITRTKPLCLFPPPLSVTNPPLIEASPITPQWRSSLSEVWSKATLQVWSYGGKWWLVLMIIFLSKTLFSFTYLIIVLNWGLHVHLARVRLMQGNQNKTETTINRGIWPRSQRKQRKSKRLLFSFIKISTNSQGVQ